MRKRNIFVFFLAVSLLFLSLPSCIREDSVDLTVLKKVGAVGVESTIPSAEAFIENLPEGYQVSFSEDTRLDVAGVNQVHLIVKSPFGKIYHYDTTFTLLFDREAPTISGVKDLSACIGDGIAYRSGITVTDDADPEPTLTVRTDKVNVNVAGVYPITYVATDFTGKSSEMTASVHIYEDRITEEMLMEKVEAKLSSKIKDGMSIAQKVRVVYDFVYDSLNFVNESDKTDWVRAAYNGLQNGSGDCFTYFALSKACFEYLGIENLDVTRTEGIVAERHYWNLVNIGDGNWYHFDACHLIDQTKPFGYLMTDSQLKAYSQRRYFEGTKINNYFYAFDTSAYPTRATKVMTNISGLY